ncbi:hypothetical protein [Phenylobacterium sp.]
MVRVAGGVLILAALAVIAALAIRQQEKPPPRIEVQWRGEPHFVAQDKR